MAISPDKLESWIAISGAVVDRVMGPLVAFFSSPRHSSSLA